MNKCVTFITTIASKLLDRSPLASVIVRNDNVLNPNDICCTPGSGVVGEENETDSHKSN